MPKRHHPYAAGGNTGWSIGSNSLTAAGQSELLRDLGRQLQHSYQSALKEPAPDRIRQLLERLERTHLHERNEDH
ncbi:NepR family anti-sigma factor [Microvirga sp. BSC39]|uniref:NepR family anti-sigma factor n=1 Tax=Microvirga sp. BSC39 TaxID=1549810 RepID=UPI00126A4910|nr:NepR family anti-sigma factor [Microvirga sp. BSC39]